MFFLFCYLTFTPKIKKNTKEPLNVVLNTSTGTIRSHEFKGLGMNVCRVNIERK